MLFGEMIKMALSSLGANKLRSALTMLGITIGVFSVISVMTAVGALQYSIENGISFLGSNIFQFGKYPANISASGDVQEKFRNRHNITYQQALHYYRLMEGEAREICLKSFGKARRFTTAQKQPRVSSLSERIEVSSPRMLTRWVMAAI